ncbi:MAG TPA: hypothetical protein VF704_03880 [Allosphingosinicella sp.]|jgi:hypothetical protein
MRAIGGLLAGLAAMVVAIMAVGAIGGLFFSVEAPTDPMQNAEATVAALSNAPPGTKIVLVLSWFIGALAGAAVAKRISRLSWPGWVIAGGLALMLASTFLVPLPVWMQIAAVLAPLAGGLIADMLVRGVPSLSSEAADARL